MLIEHLLCARQILGTGDHWDFSSNDWELQVRCKDYVLFIFSAKLYNDILIESE